MTWRSPISRRSSAFVFSGLTAFSVSSRWSAAARSCLVSGGTGAPVSQLVRQIVVLVGERGELELEAAMRPSKR